MLRLPPGLAAATSLRRLFLDNNRQLQLALEDVHSILLRLPALRWLQLNGCATHPTLLSSLRSGAPLLEVVTTPREEIYEASRSDESGTDEDAASSDDENGSSSDDGANSSDDEDASSSSGDDE